MNATHQIVQDLVRERVASEIVCQELKASSARVGCVLPLQYDNGDSIVVWVEAWGDRYRVSDVGESLLDAPARKPGDRSALEAEARLIAAPWGVGFTNGALVTQAGHDELGDVVWRTAQAAASIAQTAVQFRKPRPDRGKESAFAAEVEHELREHSIEVAREVRLDGGSGHPHHATIFIPSAHAIVEPINAAGHFNQVSAVYTKLGDLGTANGYEMVSLIDDRADGVGDDLIAMLTQVSDVVRWSRHEAWVDSLV